MGYLPTGGLLSSPHIYGLQSSPQVEKIQFKKHLKSMLHTLANWYLNPIPYGEIANYGVFCLANMLFYYLTFHITGLPNFWQKKNGNFSGEPPLWAP